MPLQPKYPVTVRRLTTGDTNLDRAQDNIINPLNATLQTLNSSPTVNYVFMGSIDTTLAGSNWYTLRVDNASPFYYMNDVQTSMIYVAATVFSTNTNSTAQFRLINVASGAVVWTSAPAPRTNVPTALGSYTPGVYTLDANTPYAIQMFGAASVDGMAWMKVSY